MSENERIAEIQFRIHKADFDEDYITLHQIADTISAKDMECLSPTAKGILIRFKKEEK